MKNWIKSLEGHVLLVYVYLTILLFGFVLLCLPFSQVIHSSPIDHLFTATSALSTTGLATVNIQQSYTFFGEVIILLLVQIGGMGYMSLGSMIVLLRRNKLSARESELIQYDYSLPLGFNLRVFITRLVIFVLTIEALGAAILTYIFYTAGESNPLWKGVFHSVSAFCTAGLSLFSNSFEDYATHTGLNLTILALSLFGALGFIVFTDTFDRLFGRKKQITFTSKIIIRVTTISVVIGTLVLFLSDHYFQSLQPEHGLMLAFFQAISSITTVGFNTTDISAIRAAPLFFIMLLMVVGASPSGTGGGIKSTTLTALFALLKSTLRGDDRVIYLNRVVPSHRIKMAASNFFFYVIVICIGTYLLLLLEPADSFRVLFEVVSALGTVGLSLGLTPELSSLGKLIVICLMFLGRIGPISFGIALFKPAPDVDLCEEDIAI